MQQTGAPENRHYSEKNTTLGAILGVNVTPEFRRTPLKQKVGMCLSQETSVSREP